MQCAYERLTMGSRYIVDSDQIKSNLNQYSIANKIYFPLKTNDLPEVLNILKKNKTDFLINNTQNLQLLKSMGISPLKVIDINYLNSPENREAIYSQGVRSFAFGSFEGLMKFNYIKNIQALFRMNLVDFSSAATPIGASISELSAMYEYAQKQNNNNIGLQIYINKKMTCDIDELLANVVKTLFSYNIHFSFLNIGGIHNPTVLYNIFNKYKSFYPQINFEIGEGIINNAVHCIATIRDISPSGAVFISRGIYNGFLDAVLYNKKYDIFVDNKTSLSKKYVEGLRKIQIWGPSCDSHDFIGEYWIPEEKFEQLRPGNKIYIKNIGAYFNVFDFGYASE